MDLFDADNPFDDETWSLLPGFFEKLPEPVLLHCWGDPEASVNEKQAKILMDVLSNRFDLLESAVFPRRINYPYYPVIGVFGIRDGEAIDFGVRIIGLPKGVQMTSLIAAIQAVSFRGSTVEGKTRIRLRSLDQEIHLELLTSAEDEGGTLMAKTIFGLAVASPKIKSFLIMADNFPQASMRYSAPYLPHLVVNSRVHVEGVIEEEVLLRKIGEALS